MTITNENVYAFLDQMKDAYGENILHAFVDMPEYIQDSELEGVFEDWKEATNTLLRKTKKVAQVNGQEDAVDIIETTLDNLR